MAKSKAVTAEQVVAAYAWASRLTDRWIAASPGRWFGIEGQVNKDKISVRNVLYDGDSSIGVVNSRDMTPISARRFALRLQSAAVDAETNL